MGWVQIGNNLHLFSVNMRILSWKGTILREGGGRNKALKLPLTKRWRTEAISSIPKIRNFQKVIRKVYLRKSSALSFYRTDIVVENRV